MKPFYFSICLFLLIISGATAQKYTEADTVLANRYFVIGDSLMETSQFRDAIVNFEKALPIYVGLENSEKSVATLNKLSACHRNIYETDEALTMATRAVEMASNKLGEDHLETAEAYFSLGCALNLKGKYDQSLVALTKSGSIQITHLGENHLKVAETYNWIGNLHGNRGSFYESLQFHHKALKIRQELVGEKNQLTARSYANIGGIYSRLGDLNLSLKNYEVAFDIFEEQLGEKHPNIIKLCINMADLYNLKGDISTSLDYSNKGLRLLREVGSNESIYRGFLHANIGSAYANREEYLLSLEYYQSSLKYLKNIFGPDHQASKDIYSSIGSNYFNMGDSELALEYFKKSLSTDQESNLHVHNVLNMVQAFWSLEDYPAAEAELDKVLAIIDQENDVKNRSALIVYSHLGRNAFLQKRYDESLLYIQKSQISNVASFDDTNVYVRPKLDGYLHDLDLLVSTTYKALSFREKHLKTRASKDLLASLANFQQCDSLIDQIRQSHRNYGDKVAFAQLASKFYEAAIPANLGWHELSKESKYHENAFYLLQKSKLGVLQEAFSDLTAKNFGNLPDSLLELERKLKIDKAYYQSQLVEHSENDIDTVKINEYQNKLFVINRNSDSLTKNLEEEYPKYHELKYKNRVITLAGIQQKLSENILLVDYFMGDSTGYIFAIGKRDYQIVKLEDVETIKEDIDLLKTSILEKDLISFKKSSSSLYRSLIAPMETSIEGENLIVIPDGELWHVNFDLLLTDSLPRENPKDLPYLLKDYKISYANSATLLFDDDQRNSKPAYNGQCLAFAFSDSSSLVGDTEYLSFNTLRDSNVDLPGARNEISSIAEIVDGQYYFGSEASESNFKKEAENYSVLHLALHGELDDRKPENSKLYFTQNQDSPEDNYLYSHEIFALNLPAELAVLSACNTGTGKLARGEGIMSLGRAFQYAGTKSLLLSQWEVSDITTPTIMKYFYKGLKDGKSKSVALRDAKLKFLENDADNLTAMPFFWGSFYILGDDSSIDSLSERMPKWLVISLASAAIFGLLLVSLRFSSLYKKKV